MPNPFKDEPQDGPDAVMIDLSNLSSEDAVEKAVEMLEKMIQAVPWREMMHPQHEEALHSAGKAFGKGIIGIMLTLAVNGQPDAALTYMRRLLAPMPPPVVSSILATLAMMGLHLIDQMNNQWQHKVQLALSDEQEIGLGLHCPWNPENEDEDLPQGGPLHA